MNKIKTKVDLFKTIISKKNYFPKNTKSIFWCGIFKDKNYKKINKVWINNGFKDFKSKQEMIEFWIIIFLYKYNPNIKKLIDEFLKENKLIFSKYNDESLPDIKIGKYWYEITTILSNMNAYDSYEEFLNEIYEKMSKNNKSINVKNINKKVFCEEVINYFIKIINDRISKKIDKTYKENGKKFKIKKLIIFEVYPIKYNYSILFLETWINKCGKEIYKKIKNNIKIYICFPKPFNQEKIKHFEINEKRSINSYKAKGYIKPEQNIVIEIDQNNKKIYENNKLKYKTNFFENKFIKLKN